MNNSMGEVVAQIIRNRELLEGDLRPPQLEILKAYTENMEEYQHHITELAFLDGFSAACRLLLDALGG